MKLHVKASSVGTRTQFPKRSSTGCSVMQCILYIQPQGHEIIIIYHTGKVTSPMTLAWTLTLTQTSSLVSLSSSTSSHSTPSCWAMYSHVTFSPPEKHKQQKKKKKEDKISSLLQIISLSPPVWGDVMNMDQTVASAVKRRKKKTWWESLYHSREMSKKC